MSPEQGLHPDVPSSTTSPRPRQLSQLPLAHVSLVSQPAAALATRTPARCLTGSGCATAPQHSFSPFFRFFLLPFSSSRPAGRPFTASFTPAPFPASASKSTLFPQRRRGYTPTFHLDRFRHPRPHSSTTPFRKQRLPLREKPGRDHPPRLMKASRRLGRRPEQGGRTEGD
jgi:hypothetical protein